LLEEVELPGDAEGMREWVKTGQDEGEVCGRAGEGGGVGREAGGVGEGG
jgi:hypothetical protein